MRKFISNLPEKFREKLPPENIQRRLQPGPEFWTLEKHSNLIRYLLAIVMALLAGCVLFVQQGEDPLNATLVMFQGGLSNIVNFGTSIRWATPCLIAGGAVVIAYRSGFQNMGIEGQMLMGGLAAGLVGYLVELPHIPHLLLCFLAAGIAGMLYALIPALLRLYFNISELVVTIMLNFVAQFFTYYYVYWILMGGTRSKTGAAAIKTENILDSAEMGTLIKGTTASTAFLFGIIFLLVLNVVYKRTIVGYEAVQIGENMEYARAGGVNVVKRFFQIFLCSGFVAGLCGGMEVCGSYHYFLANFPGNLGWEVFMVANASRYDPIALIFISCIWGIMKSGSLQLERVTSLSRYSVNIVQMLFILFVAVDYVALYRYCQRRYRIRRERKLAEMEGKQA